ncbi:hypothetical protein, partial [Streptomyces sp. GC420]|uniref:hypothetical protein n=1 Tax=Streptomyces sp. GC420 TaxID=2697568 RepID=UPI001D7F55EC|nr:hypothetical protein [Streptomyces sp. GC420]
MSEHGTEDARGAHPGEDGGETMAGFRDFLARFRPAGSPGAAPGGAVPVDRSAELAAELEGPLALLDSTTEEADAIRAEAVRGARQRREEATRRAADIVAAAQAAAPEVRANAAARRRAEAARGDESAARAADAAVTRLRERAHARMPTLVARAVTDVTGELRTLSRSGPPDPVPGHATQPSP